MREIRPYGSEGGVALTTPLLPLSVWGDSVGGADTMRSAGAVSLFDIAVANR